MVHLITYHAFQKKNKGIVTSPNTWGQEGILCKSFVKQPAYTGIEEKALAADLMN